MEKIDITIIGGGVLGLSTGYMLAEKYPNKSIVILEKEKYLGDGQSGRSSGVSHCGHFFRPGSLKAKLCVEGNEMLRSFAQEHHIQYRSTGKLTVAQNEEEEKDLDRLLENAMANGVEGVLKLTREEIKEYEPNVHAHAALYTPTTGIIDAAEYVQTLERLVTEHDSIVMKQARATNVIPNDGGFVISVDQQGESYDFVTETLINAAGLHGDEIGRMINPDFAYDLKPLMGEFMKFSKKKRPELFMNGLNVYAVPKRVPNTFDEHGNPQYMSRVHLTPKFEKRPDGSVEISDSVLVGPFSHPVNDKDDYSRTEKTPEDFCDEVKGFYQGLRPEDLEEDYVGIQVKIVGYDDFVIEQDSKHPNAYHMIASSPGLTSSLGIAKYAIDEVIRMDEHEAK